MGQTGIDCQMRSLIHRWSNVLKTPKYFEIIVNGNFAKTIGFLSAMTMKSEVEELELAA